MQTFYSHRSRFAWCVVKSEEHENRHKYNLYFQLRHFSAFYCLFILKPNELIRYMTKICFYCISLYLLKLVPGKFFFQFSAKLNKIE